MGFRPNLFTCIAHILVLHTICFRLTLFTCIAHILVLHTIFTCIAHILVLHTIGFRLTLFTCIAHILVQHTMICTAHYAFYIKALIYILYFITVKYNTIHKVFSNMESEQDEYSLRDDVIYIEQFNHHHHITRLNYILLHQQHAEYDINIFHFLIFYTSFFCFNQYLLVQIAFMSWFPAYKGWNKQKKIILIVDSFLVEGKFLLYLYQRNIGAPFPNS